MATTTLVPTGTNTSSFTVVGAATQHEALTDGSDASYVEGLESGNGFYPLTNMPANWASITNLTISARTSQSGNVDDTFSLKAQITDDFSSPLSASVFIYASHTNHAIRNDAAVTLGSLTSTTDKTVWDGAALLLSITETQSMGDDGGNCRVYEISLTMTYTETGLSVVCPVIATSNTIFNPTIINTQEILLNVLNATSTILSPAISAIQIIQANLISAPSSVLSPAAELLLETTTINAASTLFNPTVNTLNTVEFNVINVPGNVFSPATDTTVNVESQLITTASTVFNPTLNQDVVLPTLAAPSTINNFTVSSVGGEQDVNLEVVGANSTINSPSVTTLNIIQCNVINAPSTIQAPALKYDVVLPVISTVSVLFSPSLEYLVELPVLNTSPTLYPPRIGDEVDDGFSGAIIKTYDPSPFPSGVR
jgi:hypothetical protein